jgi:voltage-gated potassium channel Kch
MPITRRRITFADHLRYNFDKSMAAGPIALIGWLALVSMAMIGVFSIVLVIARIGPAPTEKLSFIEAAWMSLMRTLDAGTMGGDQGWPFRTVMFLVTLGGIFLVSSLIGVLTSGLESKMDELRKGRSFVIEKDHQVILGWSSSVFTIISELVVANENQKKPRIVVLAEKDKVEMEEEIRSKVGSTKNTKVICRTGSPIDLYDLELVNPHESKSIIILSPESENPDSQVIKSILALTNNPARRAEPYHIVAEIRDAKSMEAARLVGRDEAVLIEANDLIARITVQTCRQSGMSVVYTELLDFDGDEIYFQEEPSLTGKTFGEALFAYEDSAVMGMHFANGHVKANPPMDTVIAAGDKLIAISEDDDKVVVSGKTEFGVDVSAIREGTPVPSSPERTLILGWNRRGCAIINELDNYVAQGSEIIVIAETDTPQTEITRFCGNAKNQRITFREGDTTDRATLDSLEVTAFSHVIVLAYSEALPPQQADAKTLITLLHLRNIEETTEKPISIVSEMLDVRNRELAEVTQADDFIVSDKLISLLMSQVSENKALHALFADLFDSEGSEIYLKPARNYVAPGATVNFYTVVEAARRRGEVAIGYRIIEHAHNAGEQYGIVVNPSKSETVTFAADDLVIVVAED